ncbi:MAG TPA: fatty acid desaturase [Polyangiaceae bacterium]
MRFKVITERFTMAPLTLTDPTSAPTYGDGPISRWCQRHLVEARDEVFVRLTLRAVATQTLAMAALFATLHFTHVPAWIPILAYFAYWGWATPPIILMLHCTMHRKFIKSPKSLDKAHPFVMSFFFGMPMGYREHHVGMHHVEDNMGRDLSSTIRYRRDSFANFLVYFFRFFFLTIIELPIYLARAKRKAMARRAVLGEMAHWLIIAGAMAIDWRFGAAAFLAPWATCRFMMMVGNWGQHAFVNTGRKNNGIANAITCINSTYNKRCFNDGYHIGHHLRANRHWTEMPKDFLDSREMLAKEGAIVFEGLDFFFVSVLLWLGAWNVLAKRFVRLGEPKSDEEVIALLKSRVQPVRSWPAEKISAQRTAAAA